MQEPDFLSVLASRFSDFLVFRELGGLDPQNQIPLLRPRVGRSGSTKPDTAVRPSTGFLSMKTSRAGGRIVR